MFNGICLCIYVHLHICIFYIISLTRILYILLFENIYRCQSIHYVLKICICLKQIKLLYCIVYDGAGNMSGKLRGASTTIKDVHLKLIYIHCNAHQLNLCIMKSCKILPVTNMMSMISRLFNNSPKREHQLHQEIKKLPEKTSRKLLDVCKTRCVQWYDAMEVFIDFLPAILNALDQTNGEEWNRETTNAARSFAIAVTLFEFVFTLIKTICVLSVTKGLCKKLQSMFLDIVCAHNEIDVIRNQVADMREYIDSFHGTWFEEAMDIAKAVDIEVKHVRTFCRQTMRSNAPACSVTEHLKRNVTIPLLDHLESELNDRFSSTQVSALKGLYLIPTVLMDKKTSVSKKTLKSDLIKTTAHRKDHLKQS